MARPSDVGVGVSIILWNAKGQVLLGLRKGSHRAGTWACPGGWIDRTDTSTLEAAQREVQEETGLTAQAMTPGFWTTEDHPDIGVRTVTLYHWAWCLEGEPQVMEPDKCAEWRWFDLDALPDTLFPGLAEALAHPMPVLASAPRLRVLPDLSVMPLQRALDYIFEYIESRMWEQDPALTQHCNQFLRWLEAQELDTTILVGALVATRPWRKELEARPAFFEYTKRQFSAKYPPGRVDLTLSGLE